MDTQPWLTEMPPRSFLEGCAFLCIDLQENAADPFGPPKPVTDATMPPLWKEMGFTPEDVNEANDFAYRVCAPNARRVADACLGAGLPRIFVHWGARYEDLCDIDPEVRSLLVQEGPDPGTCRKTYPPSSRERPAAFLGVRDGDYVLAKTAQDAFRATPLEFMLRNLRVRNLVFVGGHTGACLGKTARTARELGYGTLCVEDATSNAFESNRIERLLAFGFDWIVRTAAFEAWMAAEGREQP